MSKDIPHCPHYQKHEPQLQYPGVEGQMPW
jgi:hypothetical protein